MPKIADRPLTKVTMNFYTEDIEWLRANCVEDYTVVIRDVVRTFILEQKALDDE